MKLPLSVAKRFHLNAATPKKLNIPNSKADRPSKAFYVFR